MLKEFKEFAMKGSVVDLAIGVVIGAAFGKIVDSLVNDVIMPGVGMLTGGVDFSDKKVVLKEAVVDAAGKVTTPENALKYGVFLNQIISFLIVAFALFMVVKAMNKMKRAEPEAPAAAPEPTKEEVLLTEIRDALKAK